MNGALIPPAYNLVTQIAGVDYGSKLAGTTVIAFVNEVGEITFAASEKEKDADQFVLEWAIKQQPSHLFLDAPLSLPGIYTKLPGCDDYFYRQADRALQAMSPMFLGGLTARAIQLQNKLQKLGIEVIEVYPSYLARIFNLDKTLYKKQKEQIDLLLPQVTLLLGRPIPLSPPTWHHFDALLALCSGFRYLQNQHLSFGNLEEGFIVI